MKHSAIIAIGLFICLSYNLIQAQTNLSNDYIIVSTANVSETTPYANALDAANWEQHRLQGQRCTLVFDTGLTIELKSAIELVNLGYSINLSDYPLDRPTGYVSPVLKLLPGNYIGMEYQYKTDKNSIKQ